MLPLNNRDELYILTAFWGYPQTCLELEGRVTYNKASVIDVLINQTAHAI